MPKDPQMCTLLRERLNAPYRQCDEGANDSEYHNNLDNTDHRDEATEIADCEQAENCSRDNLLDSHASLSDRTVCASWKYCAGFRANQVLSLPCKGFSPGATRHAPLYLKMRVHSPRLDRHYRIA